MLFRPNTKPLEKILTDHSPVVLTVIGVTGTITSVLLMGRATAKAVLILEKEAYLRELKLDPRITHSTPMAIREKAELVWKLYIPVVSSTILTVTCIIAANRIGTRRTAALAAAYSLSEKAIVEYKNKVVETIGEKGEQQVRDRLAQDRVTNDPVTSREVIITGVGDVLCYEAITGRYFESTMETLRKAQNDINAQIINDTYATLHDFFSHIGLTSTPYCMEIGWNTDALLDLKFSATLADDGRPCISIEYNAYPIREFGAY